MRFLRLALVAMLLGCVAPSAPAPVAPKSLPPVEAAPSLAEIGLKPRTLSREDLDPRSAGIRALSGPRFTVDVQDADLASFVLGLGRGTPLNVVVGPNVRGTISADLEEVTLLEILDEVARPRGFNYEVEGRTLRVYHTDRETRFYKLNYPNTQRDSDSQFKVTGAIASKASAVDGGTGSDDVSTSKVTTSQQLDLWSEVEAGIQLIVYGKGGGDSEDAGADAPSSRVLVSRQSGVLMVTAPREALDEVERYLKSVGRNLARQVLIDTRIVEVSLADELDFGIDNELAPKYDDKRITGTIVRSITGSLTRDNATGQQLLAPALTSGGFTFGIASDTVGAILTALARQSDLRVISTPRIATLNNHKALIKVVRNEVFFIAETDVSVTEGVAATAITDFKPSVIPIGVTLDVTPMVSEEDQITLHVHPSVSEIVEIRSQPVATGQSSAGSLPVVDIRETDTVLRLDNGQTVVIGGLIQRRMLDIERKTPLLGDIPWLGQLFRGTDVEEKRSELIIFLTPRVLDPPTIEKVVSDGYDRLEKLDEERLSRRVIRRPWWRRPNHEGGLR